MKEKDKKEGLFKRLKNIEDKSEEQLKIIRNKTGIKSQIDLFNEDLTSEAIALIKKLKNIEDSVDYYKLFFTGGNKKVYGFDSFMTLEKLKNMTTDRAEIKQNKYAEKLNELRDYPARMSKYIDLKESVSKNAKNVYDGWGKMFIGLKMEYYHFLKGIA